MTSKHTSIHRISSSHCGYAGPAGQPQGPWAAPTRSPRSDTFRPSHSAAHAWVPRGPNEKMDGSMDIHRYIYIYTYIYMYTVDMGTQDIWNINSCSKYICLETMFLYYVVQIHAHTIFFSQGCGVWFSQKEASTCLMHKSSVKARMSDAENTWSHWPRHHAGAVNTIFEIPPDNAVQRSINGWKIAGYSPTI